MNEGLIGAIEAGGTKFVLALADRSGAIRERVRIATRTPAECFPEVASFFSSGSARHGPISAFGVASFGPIGIDPRSPDYGRFGATPKPGWSGARFQDVLGQFGAPILVDTDVNGAAVGEWVFGAGRGCNTIAYTTVGTGIGSGVVQDGRPLAGFSHYETGHIPVARNADADGFVGTCPFHGDCLEGLASGPAIAARWGASLSDSPVDPARIELIAGYLSQLATNLVLLHMPERLVFGGGVMKTPGLMAALRRATELRLGGYLRAGQFDPGLERFIVPPQLGDDAGISGAILLATRGLAVAAMGDN